MILQFGRCIPLDSAECFGVLRLSLAEISTRIKMIFFLIFIVICCFQRVFFSVRCNNVILIDMILPKGTHFFSCPNLIRIGHSYNNTFILYCMKWPDPISRSWWLWGIHKWHHASRGFSPLWHYVSSRKSSNHFCVTEGREHSGKN